MRVRRFPLLAAAASASLLVLLIGLAWSGHRPEFRGLVAFKADGVVQVRPDRVSRIEIRSGRGGAVLHRGSDGWVAGGDAAAVPQELAEHVETGLRFLNVSRPARAIDGANLDVGRFAEFGLDPPSSLLLLSTDDGPAATVNFGALNPAGTSQYARVGGAATVYLLPRHVGGEWAVVQDMVGRIAGAGGVAPAGQEAGLLFPVSMTQVWALEVVRGGKMTRFERDGAGNWFRHTGQHSHAAGASAHTADPAQARTIGAALSILGETVIERRVADGADPRDLAEFGLAFPQTILLLYARDASTPVARVEVGDLAGSFDRYARLAPSGDVVTIADFEVRRLSGLLKDTGTDS